MKTAMRKALDLGWINFLSYFVLTWDIRTVSQGNIPYAVVVNIIIALLSFSLFKKMQEADKTWLNRAAYTLCGTLGTVAGILLSQWMLGR